MRKELVEKYSAIAAELLAMTKVDQDMRASWKPGAEWDSSSDEQHTERLKEIIADIGWPTVSKVGEDASRAAWLIAQHVSHDQAFQRRCLDLMRQTPEGEVHKPDLALLEDHVRVQAGLSQLYGSQFYMDAEGNFNPQPIEDPEYLDERRRDMGLQPFAEYERDLRARNKRIRTPHERGEQS